MLRKIFCTSAVVVTALALGCTAWAQTIEVGRVNPATHTLTINLKGMIGPILSGSDPLNLNGESGSLKVVASESLSPIAHTATSATYKLPPGAITVTAGSNKFTTKSPAKMIIKLTSTADTLTLVASGVVGGFSVMVTDATFLKTGSWTTAVLKHPGAFAPTPQKVTAAKTATGAGCKIKYTVLGNTSVLGFSGTASNTATVDPVLPEVDWGQ